ncbi:MAG: glycosyltransferase family 2 protein [Micrococcales bacterium]
MASGLLPGLYYSIARLFWWFAFRLAQRDETQPKVTVVVPVYNVEQYLADCLRSIRAQNYKNFEIIAVNDGATDGSAAILQKFAATTRNLRIVTQHNQGLGAARNAGVAAAQNTDYLMFVDSDDLLPLAAISRYVKQAQSSGSKLVVGKTVCFYGMRFFARTSTAKFFTRNLTATDLNHNPEFLGDATSWNKLYAFDFWQQHKLAFPNGVWYEDMTLVCTAYLAAGKFDVLKAPSYFWRVRAEGESLSKRTREFKALQDRLLSIEQIDKILKRAIEKGLIEKHVHDSYLTRIISMDLQLFVGEIPETDEQYFNEFKSRAGAVLAEADESVWANATGAKRAAVWVAAHGNRDQVVQQL